MRVLAGVDVGNATTEVVILAAGPGFGAGRVLGAGRVPTRGRKGSADSLRGAAALVRRLERRLGCQVAEVRVAPLRAVETATVTVPEVPPQTGRLRVIAAGSATPGGTGICVGPPVWLDGTPPAGGPAGEGPVVAVVPAGLGYQEAVAALAGLEASGVTVGAVLAASDEGVLIANRTGGRVPVADQADVAALAGCELVAVEVRPPGQPLVLLTDPVALGAALRLGEKEAGAVTLLCRSLADYSNAVVALTPPGTASAVTEAREPWLLLREPAGPGQAGLPGGRASLRDACPLLAGWPVGAVRAFGTGGQAVEVGDLFAVDLSAVAESATARRDGLGRALLAASLAGAGTGIDPAGVLGELLGVPARILLSEPAAARLGAVTTPGALADAVVIDVGAGTIDAIGPDGDVVAAGAGDLLTLAVAETLGIPRAAADWVKRGPCLRVDGGQRFETETGHRGFLDRPAPANATGMLAVPGPAGLLPFGHGRSPGEWRALRLRLKQAVLAVNLSRALRSLAAAPRQVLVVGGPAGDDELTGVLTRSLPEGVAVGRGNVGASLGGGFHGEPLGHRYAAALGLALADG